MKVERRVSVTRRSDQLACAPIEDVADGVTHCDRADYDIAVADGRAADSTRPAPLDAAELRDQCSATDSNRAFGR